MHNTLYIAEPIFSEKLQQFDSQASAVAGAECNTVIELTQAYHVASP